MISFIPKNPKLAFAYVPFQAYGNVYPAENALVHGTIFKELNIPFPQYKDNPLMNPYKKPICK